MIRAALFDFDGVILDSNRVKRGAFFTAVEEVYPGQGELVASLIDDRHPLTRQRFMAKVAERLVPVGGRADAALDLVARYGRIVDEGLMAAPFVRGAEDTLALLAGKMPLYLNTQNPRDAIVPILEGRGLMPHFTAVYGSERSKGENIDRVLTDGFEVNEIVMIGDGILDWTASRDKGVPFIAVNPTFEMPDYPPVATRSDLTDLAAIIESL